MTGLSLGGSKKYGKNLQGFPRVVELPANRGLRRLVRTILLIKSLPNVPPHSLMIRDFVYKFAVLHQLFKLFVSSTNAFTAYWTLLPQVFGPLYYQ